jgi:hypothetical protein
MEITHAQSKNRFAPACDQALRRIPGVDLDDFETSQSFFEGRNPVCLSATSEVTRWEDRFILVDSDASGTYDLVLTLTLHKVTTGIGVITRRMQIL